MKKSHTSYPEIVELISTDHTREALDTIEAKLKAAPSDSELFYLKGICLWRRHMDESKNVRACFIRSNELNEDDIRPLMHLAVQIPSTAEFLTRQHPELAPAWFYHGFHSAGRLSDQEVIHAFTQAIELDHEYVAAYFYRGNLHFEMRNYYSAAADYREALNHFAKPISVEYFLEFSFFDVPIDEHGSDKSGGWAATVPLDPINRYPKLDFQWDQDIFDDEDGRPYRGSNLIVGVHCLKKQLEELSHEIEHKPVSIDDESPEDGIDLQGDYAELPGELPKTEAHDSGVTDAHNRGESQANPDLAEALALSARIHIRAHDFEGATLHGTRISPDCQSFSSLLASAEYDWNTPEGGIDSYNTAIAKGLKDPEVYRGRGEVKLWKGKTVEAIEDFTVALNLKPDLVPALHCRGSALLLQQKYPDAAADFCRIVKLTPNHHGSRVLAIHSLLFAEAYEEAVNLCDEGIDQAPYSFVYFTLKSCAHILLAKYHIGGSCLKKAQSILQSHKTLYDEYSEEDRACHKYELVQLLIDVAISVSLSLTDVALEKCSQFLDADLNKSRPEGCLKQILEFVERSNPAKLSLIQTDLEVNPLDDRLRIPLSYFYYLRSEYDAALKLIGTTNLNKVHVEPLIMQCMILIKKGLSHETPPILDKAIRSLLQEDLKWSLGNKYAIKAGYKGE
ncbi:MAG: hypothetical protein NTU47_04050 [Ignavibacteriales bacterium]|nr:hypothetical protein [Ignavibacteriales bacterium]